MNLVQSPHLALPDPAEVSSSKNLIRGDYEYWHYICDGFDDRGWGCGYRTLQTLISWCEHNISRLSSKEIPSLRQIQEILVNIEDKPKSFLGSKEWIGSVEVGLVLDVYCDIPTKIVHVKSGKELAGIFSQLEQHFKTKGSPIMMGGDMDCSSKGIFGTFSNGENKYLLVLDPHFVRKDSNAPKVQDLLDSNWIHWRSLDDFVDSSFYNLALPQVTL